MKNTYTIEERNRIVEEHLWCIKAVIKQNRALIEAAHLDRDDVFQDLSIRLIRAVGSYDPDKGTLPHDRNHRRAEGFPQERDRLAGSLRVSRVRDGGKPGRVISGWNDRVSGERRACGLPCARLWKNYPARDKCTGWRNCVMIRFLRLFCCRNTGKDMAMNNTIDLFAKFSAVEVISSDRISETDKDFCERNQAAYGSAVASYQELAFCWDAMKEAQREQVGERDESSCDNGGGAGIERRLAAKSKP